MNVFIYLPFVSVESLGNSFVTCFSSDISKAIKRKERSFKQMSVLPKQLFITFHDN